MMNPLKIFAMLLVTVSMVACNSGTKSGNDASDESASADDTKKEAPEPNTLSTEEAEQGFYLLFDGMDTEGWRGYNMEVIPGAWEVVDGTLYCEGSGRGEAGAEDGGDIIYDKKFSNFHLKLEWKISEGGNSGIFYLGQESPEYETIWRTAPEMQVLDNERHPDAMLGENGNRKAGSLYDLIPADPQNAKPAGEWNSAEIICYKGTVVHKQNGATVLEYHLWTPEWEELVADSKFPSLNEDWADVAKEGYIGIQDHGDDVWFRSIKIREL
ncbi:MAG: DUF1080 domain-containing protein [Bacteroidales bacterium]|nr:DUF1080 domain-containing protein [Bacteroidales bacterium]MDT8431749.1 DUF1080 domain-containing protein [Bacteroidales bacterium]